MRIRFTAKYLLAFSALIFLIHEGHDWAHFIVGRLICGCWGIKSFDNWTLCNDCNASAHSQVWIWFAGPVITYIIIWISWRLLDRKHVSSQKSLGFSLLFATIPFVRILAALVGGSDETYGLRQLFQRADKSNSHAVALSGLILILVLTGIPLLRAFMRLTGWKEKLILFPIFLVVPMFIDKWTYVGLNKLSASGFLQDESLPGVPVLVLVWSLLWTIVLLLTYKSLFLFLQARRETY